MENDLYFYNEISILMNLYCFFLNLNAFMLFFVKALVMIAIKLNELIKFNVMKKV